RRPSASTRARTSRSSSPPASSMVTGCPAAISAAAAATPAGPEPITQFTAHRPGADERQRCSPAPQAEEAQKKAREDDLTAETQGGDGRNRNRQNPRRVAHRRARPPPAVGDVCPARQSTNEERGAHRQAGSKRET